MHKDSGDQHRSGDSAGNAGHSRKTAAKPDERTRGTENTIDKKPEQADLAPPPRRLRQRWLREIAKTAASARWQRGD